MKKKMKSVLSMVVVLGVCLCLPMASLAGSGDGAVSPEKKGLLASGNKLIDQIKLTGDIRVRYELMDKDVKAVNGDDTTRDRLRNRFRMGLVWDNQEEGWQACAGLTTGDDTPTGTNDTWGEEKPFETGDIRLDYAYAKHQWDDISLALGQQPNTYKSSWVMWDSDVRLTGLTLAYGAKEGLFATGGVYGVKYVNKDDTSLLYTGQVGYSGTFGEKGKATIAAGYQTYTSEMIREDAALGATSKFGLGGVDSNDYGLDVADLYGDVSLPAGISTVKVYGHAWMNFGADGVCGQAGASFPEDPEDSNLGWVLGAEAKVENFKFGYAYSMVEADSLFGYLADADFGDGVSKTNKKGHKVALSYSVTPNWSTDVTYLYYERIEDYASAKEDHVNLAQFDVNYKF